MDSEENFDSAYDLFQDILSASELENIVFDDRLIDAVLHEHEVEYNLNHQVNVTGKNPEIDTPVLPNLTIIGSLPENEIFDPNHVTNINYSNNFDALKNFMHQDHINEWPSINYPEVFTPNNNILGQINFTPIVDVLNNFPEVSNVNDYFVVPNPENSIANNIEYPVNFGASTSSTANDINNIMVNNEQIGQGINNVNLNNVSDPRLFTIVHSENQFFPRFNLNGKKLHIRFEDPKSNNILRWVDDCLSELVDHIKRDMRGSDRVGLQFSSLNFPEKPFFISLRLVNQLNKDIILSKLNDILQSNQHFFMNDWFNIFITHINMPNPTGRGRTCDNMSFDTWLKKHNGAIIDVDVENNFCFAYSLICAIIFKTSNKMQWQQFRRNLKRKNYNSIDELMESFWFPLGIDISNGASIEKILQVQEKLKNEFRLIIFTDRTGNGLLFTPTIEKSENITDIHLYIENNHIVFIKPNSLQTVFGYIYFCIHCKKGFKNRERHPNCEFRCSSCLNSSNCIGVDIYCGDCNRMFKGQECFSRHLTKNVCRLLKKCCECGFMKFKQREHECNKTYCRTCFCNRDAPHYCFIAPLKPKKINENVLYIYFDFECRQDELLEGSVNKYIHIPNLCVAFQKCSQCLEIENILEIDNNCLRCGQRKYIFAKENILENFMKYVLNTGEKFDEVIVISHNGKSYDNHFILKAVIENSQIKKPEIILNGAQIYAIFIGNIKFIDSLNFFNCSLAKLPKMFGFENLEKGHYPHLWNTKANENAPPAPLPAKEYFIPKAMSKKDRKDFENWHDELTSQNFIFHNFSELVKYCVNDVFILMQACSRFSKLFKKLTDFDVFPNSITIASACNKVFRTNHLEKDTIPLIPKSGYRLRNNQSKVAIKWLYWIIHSRKIKNLEHAGNGRERRLMDKFFVDGFDPNGGSNGTGKVFEMLGCYWHSCPKCFPKKPPTMKQLLDPNYLPETSSSIRHEETMERIKILREKYEVEYIYECEFRVVQRSSEYKAFEREFSNLWSIDKLNPRDSLFGGRVNNVKIYSKADDSKGEKILYYDVTSLYPHVVKNRSFPVGHVKKIYHGENIKEFNINSMDGLIKLKILAPDDLYLPVLPVKMHGKLLFFLCNKCALEKLETYCEHNDEERSFIGTYVITEVRLAIEKGYKILKIYEAWTYDMKVKSTSDLGLFGKYVNLFLKTKQEASGFPLDATTEEAKAAYIQSYEDHEGIKLEHIQCNEGLRTLAKLCLNNFWGKFAENEERRMTVIVKDQQSLNDLITNDRISVETIIPINDDNLLLHYKHTEEDARPLNFANVIIAAFTTAHARIELYSYLDKLQNRVIYFDTDSVIFTQKPDDEKIPLSNYLGGMTDELEKYGPGSYAVEFVSGGPKNYALRVWSTYEKKCVTICKVKGITLNSDTIEKINFESIRKMILDPTSPQEIIIKNDHKISRIVGKGVFTSKETKIYKTVLTKRVLLPNSFDTAPFGKKRRMKIVRI